jgi:sensor histidine kinase YesM
MDSLMASIPQTGAAQSAQPRLPSLRVPGSLIVFALTVALALITASECRSISHWPSLLYGAVLWCWWGAVAGLLWRVGRRWPWLLRFSLPSLAFHAVLGSLVSVAHLVLLGCVSFVVPEWVVLGTPKHLLIQFLHINRLGSDLLLYGFIYGIAGILYQQMQAQREAMRSLELEKQLSTAHLRALQMQLEPHFLFNTLNAITTLVELGRQKEASETLAHLNAILRTTLRRSAPEKVLLAQELELVENYLAIEQVRYADRLEVQIKVDPEALEGLVPCFLLQPIVENAIRHGIAHCEDHGLIQASIRRSGDRLHLEIRDNGPGRSGNAEPGHGIGLRNTQDRLSHFYADGYGFKADGAAAGGFEVAINIPYERAAV